MEIDFLEENDTFKMQIPLNRHSPILMPYPRLLASEPTLFFIIIIIIIFFITIYL